MLVHWAAQACDTRRSRLALAVSSACTLVLLAATVGPWRRCACGARGVEAADRPGTTESSPDNATVAICAMVHLRPDDPQWVGGRAEDLHEVRAASSLLNGHRCRRRPTLAAVGVVCGCHAASIWLSSGLNVASRSNPNTLNEVTLSLEACRPHMSLGVRALLRRARAQSKHAELAMSRDRAGSTALSQSSWAHTRWRHAVLMSLGWRA